MERRKIETGLLAFRHRQSNMDHNDARWAQYTTESQRDTLWLPLTEHLENCTHCINIAAFNDSCDQFLNLWHIFGLHNTVCIGFVRNRVVTHVFIRADRQMDSD